MNPLDIIKEFKLDNYLKIILNQNKANNLSYHNFYHSLCVMKNCYEIYNSFEIKHEKYTRLLCIASLFHDFNHSGGKLKDNENIQIAIESFILVSQESEEDNKIIIDTIRATEYPYVIENDDLSLLQEIIRDADLLQICEDNWLQQIILGLTNELNLSLETLLSGEKIFLLNNMNFHNKYAEEKWKKIKENRFNDIDYLTNLIK